VDVETPFRALCAQVLGARTAYLAAVGPLAPLVGPPWAYPAGHPPPPLSPDLLAPFTSPQTLYGAVDPARYGGAGWAVPLWSERGLAGVLLLGDKRDGGLYTQEEIELARASGERLIDTRASAALAQRLMALQRQRLAESQVLDRQTRRVLHDDVLPRLHTVMLKLSAGEANGTTPQALALLGEVHRQISDLLHALPPTAAPAVARLGLIGALQQAVDSELGAAFDGVRWEIAPDAAQAVQAIPPLTAEVLFYAAREAIRNAARYGRNGDSARSLHLQVGVAWHDGLEIRIEDDGVGIGTHPPAPDGSGHGLALHSTMMAVVGGALATDTLPGQYTRVTLTLPQQTWG
jgi:signal transduction histidine kinase